MHIAALPAPPSQTVVVLPAVAQYDRATTANMTSSEINVHLERWKLRWLMFVKLS